MLLLLILWSMVIAIWLAAALRHRKTPRVPMSFAIGGCLAIILGSVFGYDFFHIPAPIPITSDRAIIGGLAGLFVCLMIRRRQRIDILVAMDWSIYGLLAALLASALLTDFSYSDKLPISRFVFFYLLPAVLYFVVRHSQLRPFDLQAVAGLLVAFSLYLAVTAIAEWRGIEGLVFPKYIASAEFVEFLGRGRGPFLNPISNGIFLTAGLATAMMLFFFCQGRIKWLLLATLPILIVGNIATLTRSVWLAMVLVAGLIVFINTNRKQKGGLLVAATLSTILLVSVVGGDLINFKRDKHVTKNEMAQSALLRPIFAEIAWEMFTDRPLMGCGFGQYNKYKTDYLRSAHTRLPLEKARPYLQHNVVLSLLTETGIVGTLALLILLFNAFRIGLQNFLNGRSGNWERVFAMLLIAICISYFVNGMFHDVSIIPKANMLLFFVIAINTSIYRNQESFDLMKCFSKRAGKLWFSIAGQRWLPQMPGFEKDYVQPQQ